MKEKSLFLLMTFLLLAACSQTVDTDSPPQFIYGEDVCDRCQMIISEARYAAAYWTAAGEARRFDDVGGMFAHYEETGEAVASFWVHDFGTAAWLRAEDAYFVVDAALETPMGFGVVTCATAEAAENLAERHENSVVMDFKTLMAELETGALVLEPRHHREHSMGMEEMP